jgi:cysteine desulfurase
VQEFSFGYADAAASQPHLWPESLNALVETLALGPLNPSSVHREGQRAKKILRAAREHVAECLGATTDEVIFTSGATESLSLAMLGLRSLLAARPTIAVAAGEHDAVANLLPRMDAVRTFEPTDSAGLLVVHAVQHHTGVITDLTPWLHAAAAGGAPLIIDASQAALSARELWAHPQVTALGFSGHKIGAPAGIGVLLLRASIPFVPSLYGGPQEHELRAGTEPVALAAALAAAMLVVTKRKVSLTGQLEEQSEAFLAELASVRGVQVVGAELNRTPGIVAARVVGVPARKLVEELGKEQVFISSGAACSAQRNEPSSGALALGMSRERALEVFRVSFGFQSSVNAAQHVAQAIAKVCQRLRGEVGRGETSSNENDTGVSA